MVQNFFESLYDSEALNENESLYLNKKDVYTVFECFFIPLPAFFNGRKMFFSRYALNHLSNFKITGVIIGDGHLLHEEIIMKPRKCQKNLIENIVLSITNKKHPAYARC